MLFETEGREHINLASEQRPRLLTILSMSKDNRKNPRSVRITHAGSRGY